MIRWWSLGAGFLLRLQMDLGWLRDRLTSCLAAVLSFGAWGDGRKQERRKREKRRREERAITFNFNFLHEDI